MKSPRQIEYPKPGAWIDKTHRIHGTGIFTYIYHTNQPNVGEYTIHGSYGKWMIESWHRKNCVAFIERHPRKIWNKNVRCLKVLPWTCLEGLIVFLVVVQHEYPKMSLEYKYPIFNFYGLWSIPSPKISKIPSLHQICSYFLKVQMANASTRMHRRWQKDPSEQRSKPLWHSIILVG